MAILRFLLRSAGPMAVMMALLSVGSGACNAGLVAVVHQCMVHGASQLLLWAFIGLSVAKVVSGYYSSILLTEHSHASITELRRELIVKLLAFPYAQLERIGRERVFAALTEDVTRINIAFQQVPTVLVNLALVGGGSLYLLYLSPLAFLALSVLGLVSVVFYRRLSQSARPYWIRARDEHGRLFGHFRSLTEGAKELKQHVGRRHAFLDDRLQQTNQALLEQTLLGNTRHQLAQAGSNLSSLVAIALILFVMPQLGVVSAATTSGYVLTSLYLMGPLASALRTLPQFATAEIARQRIEELGVTLGIGATERSATRDTHSELRSFERVELADVVHHYQDENAHTAFELGPITLTLLPSEIVFITGDNGSGKSTLAKLLLGLYEPEHGELRWNGARVDDDNRDAYRQLFSVVHADYYLFDSLLGLGAADLDSRAEQWIKLLELDSKLQVRDGVLSTLHLSQGQRRRLALLTAYLEDRPIYVFDEWASDQDPAFKEVFYRALVPELRARGKCVVVITHDDRYFELADRQVALRRGQVVGNTPPQVG